MIRMILCLFIFVSALVADEYNHIKINITLRTTSPENTRKALLKFNEEKKGYLRKINNEEIIIVFSKDVPKETIIDFIKQKGIIITQNFSTFDYSNEILTLKTNINVKEKYLEQLNRLITEADLTETLEMEKEISKNIEELEILKGDYQYFLELASTIEVEIRFLSFTKTNLPANIYPGWISKLGIYNFLERFHEK
jgi:hypothetical protein